MSSCPSWRPMPILAVLGVLCLGGERPAAGQLVGSGLLSEYEASPVVYMGQASGGVGVGDRLEPFSEDFAPSPPTPSRQPAARPEATSMLASRSPIIRLAGLPNMFGDSFGSQLQVCDFACCGTMDLPPTGGTRRSKISENDKALPMCRLFSTYSHFQNAVDISTPCLGVQSFPMDQYTVGMEKTFCCHGLWSVELEMPFARTPQISGTNLEVDGGDVGNLAVTLKRLVFATNSMAVAVGLPVEVPTGSDVTGRGTSSRFTLCNDAVHLAPFIGFLNAPGDRLFCEGFFQVDLPANGNRVQFGDSRLGTLSEQSLLYVDLAVGYWLYRDRCARCVTGLAPMLEYHYTTTLTDAQMVSGTDGQQYLQFGNMYNRMDVSNVTVGLHTELGMTTVRVGASFPLCDQPNRLYDAEVQVSLNRQF
jgi:hypothetical protein